MGVPNSSTNNSSLNPIERPYLSTSDFNLGADYFEQSENGNFDSDENEMYFEEMDSSELKKLQKKYSQYFDNVDKYIDSLSDPDDIDEIMDESIVFDAIFNGITKELKRRDNAVINGTPYSNNYDFEVERHVSSMNEQQLQKAINNFESLIHPVGKYNKDGTVQLTGYYNNFGYFYNDNLNSLSQTINNFNKQISSLNSDISKIELE